MKHPIDRYLHDHQPHIYHLFSSALAKNKWSHAYLLSGEGNMPLLETAHFLAQSLICEHPHPLADHECDACLRFTHGNYTDLHVFNGAENSIKKADVQFLFDQFSIHGLEASNKQIYILHRIEFMTPEAINALLKFLEEPSLEVYAFLTTQDKEKILPTILSRSQVIQFKPVLKEKLIEDALNHQILIEDAQLLSHFLGTVEAIKMFIESSFYQAFKPVMQTILSTWLTNPKEANYEASISLIPLITDKYQALFLFDVLETMLSEVQLHALHQPLVLTSYQPIITGLSLKIKDADQLLKTIVQAKQEIGYNVNIPLYLTSFFIKLFDSL
jgi:DNA polymerase-3 subunit delta'